jgi:cytochrome c556
VPHSLRPIAYLGAAALALVAGFALAQEEEAPPSPEEMAHEAREHQMYLHAFNLGKIVPMARGEAEYDAATAAAAAESVNLLAQLLDSPLYWIPGTSTEDLEDSRALPAIWEQPEEFAAKVTNFQEAAANLEANAGTDLESLQAAMGTLGESCGSCHEDFREPEEE